MIIFTYKILSNIPLVHKKLFTLKIKPLSAFTLSIKWQTLILFKPSLLYLNVFLFYSSSWLN